MINADKKFLFLGNDGALDLLNTTPVLAQGRVELLEDYADLTRWLVEAGLIDDSAADELSRRWAGTSRGDAALAQAKKLREALRQLLVSRFDRAKPPLQELDALNQPLRAARGTAQLEWNKKTKSFSRTLLHDTDGHAAHAVTLLAEAIVKLLVEKDLSLVRKCEGPSCVLYFYDTSKNHRRRWCSMELCGNRMKVAAHHRRQKRGSGSTTLGDRQ